MSEKTLNLSTNREMHSKTSSMSGEEVVISGISGIFPKSDTVLELKANLFNQIDMVEEIKYDTIKHPNLPKHLGKINNMHKFDAQFFRVTHWQADSLDPLCRKVMECAYSAIYDSGTNPLSLTGTKLGVFVGSSYTDSSQLSLYDTFRKNNFIICGNSKSMLANRISYWINSIAPSATIDQGCASSLACLELAYNSIKHGVCEAALVGGCNACAHPGLSLNLKSAGHLCLDGKTKCFDKKGDGYVRSEAISLLFLQKAKDAKRIYTEIYHIKGAYFTECDDLSGIRKSENIEKFLQEFYSEVTVLPSEVEYVEACGLGIAEADRNELDAIGRYFAKSNCVKVGCIKSNMGHTEGASGVCAITKLCLAYHEGKLPGNLHYNDPMEDVPSVRDGRIQVVTSTTSFNRGFTALNCFSYTGANYHCLFKGHHKVKEIINYQSNIPRLILLSGREENGLNKIMDILINQQINPEEISLLHNIYKKTIPSHTGRSYLLLDTNEKKKTECLAQSFQIYPGTSRPVCFLYSGMGSQWCGMGTELLKIPVFAAAIERCRVMLEPLGVDIIKIITELDESMFGNITYSMLGIIAMQIGLTDVLNAIGIVADNYIGYSLGEAGCAYADGCLTVEEVILLSYYRGIVAVDMPLVHGSMAAVGLGYKDILPLCPPEIDVACHNSASSSTISGPSDIMSEFVSDLVSQGIFAKQVPCSNIAYHSRYVQDLAPKMLAHLKKLIQNPKLRSQKWISTLFLKQDWEKNIAKYASAEYFTSGLMNPVVFEENATEIPENAIVIEIAPHGLLQPILRRSHSECTHISLTKRGCSSPVNFLLEAIGRLHEEGLNPQIEVLYPKVEFPVSTCTPLLSHLAEWEHSTDWPIVICKKKTMKMACATEVVISLHDDDYKFMKGYARNGVYEFPESAILVLIWKILGMRKGKIYTQMSVSFHNVIFHNRLEIELEDVIRLRITIENATNRFEILETKRCHCRNKFDKP